MPITRISAKTLASMALDSFCPRCFWLQAKLEFKSPWSFFPGIFYSIDAYSKKLTKAHWEKLKKLPDWLQPFGELGEPIPVPSRDKFQSTHNASGITLVGVPDEILKRADGGLFIIDYKTSKYSDAQEELLPMYRVQLSCYSLLAQVRGLGKTWGCGLAYYQPVTDFDEGMLENCIKKTSTGEALSFYMEFVPKLVAIQPDHAEVESLLMRAKDITSLDAPPEGKPDCENCSLVKNLVDQFVNQVENTVSMNTAANVEVRVGEASTTTS